MSYTVQSTTEKKRYEWIDNARIIAAWLIVCVHMRGAFSSNPYIDSDFAFDIIKESTYFGRVPFFLILAGYFLGRKITWKKAFDRAIWLFIPFAIWNFLYYAWTHHALHLDVAQAILDLPRMLGVGAIFDRELTIFGDRTAVPSLFPTWFLRDIIALSLLTPIIAKFKKILPIIVLLACIFLKDDMEVAPNVLMLPITCVYYILGVSLSDYKISAAYLILNKKFTPFVIVGFLAAIAYVVYAEYVPIPKFPQTILGGVFGALMIAQCGVLVENHLPKLSKKIAPCGPACFLVFVMHVPFMEISRAFILPKEFSDSVWAWSFSLFTCIAIMSIFLLMKRWTPWLMPYLGHMKLPQKTAAK